MFKIALSIYVFSFIVLVYYVQNHCMESSAEVTALNGTYIVSDCYHAVFLDDPGETWRQ